jgi:NAD(P)-dependent dehydrogenase (short-subunit alcohol dehydrogenase family)
MDCGSEETNAAVHNMTSQVKVALGVGAGDAIGAAYARRFAAGGYAIAIARRDASKSAGLVAEIEAAGGVAKAYSTDARDEQSVQALFESVERDLGPVEVCLYNAGANYRAALLDTTAEMFEKVWRLGCMGGFLTGREAARHMLTRGRGSILFTGATASMRGGAGFAAFSASKWGLRALAQSMARELGPQGIHVAHLVVDGGVDSPAIHARRRAANDGKDPNIAPDALMNLDSIASAYWTLSQQTRDAWTFELDIRPFVERW